MKTILGKLLISIVLLILFINSKLLYNTLVKFSTIKNN